MRENQRSIYSHDVSKPFSEAIIRWDKSTPFTLVFTFDNEPLFIYKTRDNVPKSVTDAFQLYYQTTNKTTAQKWEFLSFSLWGNSSTAQTTMTSIKNAEKQVNEFFTDPNKMTHEQFFLRLTLLSTKYSTHNAICPKCYSQYEYIKTECLKCPTNDTLIRSATNNNQEDLNKFQKEIAKKLQSQYVLTADNYVKILLIYLRVQSNLPVLIMGETGKIHTISFFCLTDRFV